MKAVKIERESEELNKKREALMESLVEARALITKLDSKLEARDTIPKILIVKLESAKAGTEKKIKILENRISTIDQKLEINNLLLETYGKIDYAPKVSQPSIFNNIVEGEV